jgi:geranylgeranyl diphosphate synthase, type I
MDFKQRLGKYREIVNNELESYLSGRISRDKALSSHIEAILGNVREFNLRGGKRLRPILVIIGHLCISETDLKRIAAASIAVELMEGFLLIHDDIMDQDSLRRNRPTMHRIYAEGKDARFGESMAILAGDIAAALATDALIRSDFPPEHKVRALDIFTSAVYTTCLGQVLDLVPDSASIATKYRLKTAVYTVEAPLCIGAALAGADEGVMEQLSDYAIPLGTAFQIQDDLIGLYGDEKTIGKPVGSDIREGKETMLMEETMKRASRNDRTFLSGCLGKQVSGEDIEEVRRIVASSGARDSVTGEMKRLLYEARDAASRAGISDDGKALLIGLADYLEERRY